MLKLFNLRLVIEFRIKNNFEHVQGRLGEIKNVVDWHLSDISKIYFIISIDFNSKIIAINLNSSARFPKPYIWNLTTYSPLIAHSYEMPTKTNSTKIETFPHIQVN